MKVLHANDHYHAEGGVGQYILSVSELLQKAGHESVILFRHKHRSGSPDAPWPAYRVTEQENLRAQVETIVVAERPDVAYIHHLSSPAIIKAIADLLPTVAYVHGFQAVCPGQAKYYRRGDIVCDRRFGWACFPMHYLRRCSAARHPKTIYRLMARTKALLEALQSLPHLFVATQYMTQLLVQNGFDGKSVSLLAPHFFPDDFSPTYAPPENDNMLLFAGRLEIEKGVPYLLQALARAEEFAELTIAGNGTLRADYEQMAVDLGIVDQIHFAGWQKPKEMSALYRQAALVVIPSICPEAFGKTGVEALAHGRPVVAFDVGGISDWLKDGVNGYFVDPTDVGGLAETISRLLTDKKQRHRMGKIGQTQIVKRYNARHHLKTLMSAFQHNG